MCPSLGGFSQAGSASSLCITCCFPEEPTHACLVPKLLLPKGTLCTCNQVGPQTWLLGCESTPHLPGALITETFPLIRTNRWNCSESVLSFFFLHTGKQVCFNAKLHILHHYSKDRLFLVERILTPFPFLLFPFLFFLFPFPISFSLSPSPFPFFPILFFSFFPFPFPPFPFPIFPFPLSFFLSPFPFSPFPFLFLPFSHSQTHPVQFKCLQHGDEVSNFGRQMTFQRAQCKNTVRNLQGVNVCVLFVSSALPIFKMPLVPNALCPSRSCISLHIKADIRQQMVQQNRHGGCTSPRGIRFLD